MYMEKIHSMEPKKSLSFTQESVLSQIKATYPTLADMYTAIEQAAFLKSCGEVADIPLDPITNEDAARVVVSDLTDLIYRLNKMSSKSGMETMLKIAQIYTGELTCVDENTGKIITNRPQSTKEGAVD